MSKDDNFSTLYLKQIGALINSYDPYREETSFSACADVFNDLKPHLQDITDSAEFVDGDLDEAVSILGGLSDAKLNRVTFFRQGNSHEDGVIRFDLSLEDCRDARIEFDLDMDDESPGHYKLAWYGWVRLYCITGKHEFEIIENSALSEALDAAGSSDIYISPNDLIVLLPPETLNDNPLLGAVKAALNNSPDAMAAAMVGAGHYVELRSALTIPEWRGGLTDNGISHILNETLVSDAVASRADIRALWEDLSKGYPDVFQDTLQRYAENKLIEPDVFWLTDETTTKGRPVFFCWIACQPTRRLPFHSALWIWKSQSNLRLKLVPGS